MNLQKGDPGTVGRLLIRRLSQQKIEKKKKRVRAVGIAYLPLVGDLPNL